MTIPDELIEGEAGLVSPATGRPLTKRGEATRRRLLEAAEIVFAEQGYHEASIVKITERAGIGLGTFYLYFDSKQSIFEALVIDLNRRVRHSMSEAMAGASSRLDAERAGFEGFFRFTAEHPALYRVVREAEFVSPETLRLHYTPHRRGLRGRTPRRTGGRRRRPRPRSRGDGLGADGHGRADRHALPALGARCRRQAALGARAEGVRRHDALHRQRAGAASSRSRRSIRRRGEIRMTEQSLAGKRALITGGASGIGLACVREFAGARCARDRRRPPRLPHRVDRR